MTIPVRPQATVEDTEFLEAAYGPLLESLRRSADAVFVPVGAPGGRDYALAVGPQAVVTWDGRSLPDHLGDVVLFTVSGPLGVSRVRLHYPLVLTACDLLSAVAECTTGGSAASG